MKVIIVDDDEIILIIHQKLIEKYHLGTERIAFNCATEVVNYLKLDSCKSGITQYMILLDINMPVMNAWQLLDEIEANPIAAKIDVIIVSSSINQPDKDKAKSYAKVIDFIEKPLTESALIRLKDLAH